MGEMQVDQQPGAAREEATPFAGSVSLRPCQSLVGAGRTAALARVLSGRTPLPNRMLGRVKDLWEDGYGNFLDEDPFGPVLTPGPIRSTGIGTYEQTMKETKRKATHRSLVSATGDLSAMRQTLLGYIGKYQGAVEGGADGRFTELYGDLEKTRKDAADDDYFDPKAKEWKKKKPTTYTTCIDFQGRMIGRTRLTMEKAGSKFVDAWSGKFAPSGPTMHQRAKDQWTEATAGMEASKRPEKGDIYVLNKLKETKVKGGEPTISKSGEFSHVGFILDVIQPTTDPGVGMETWITVEGGQGKAWQYDIERNLIEKGEESVEVNVRKYNPVTGEITGEKNQKWRTVVHGWVDVDKIVKE